MSDTKKAKLCPFINAAIRYVKQGDGSVERLDKTVKFLEATMNDEGVDERSRVRAGEALAQIAKSVANVSVSMLALEEAKAKRQAEEDANKGTGNVTVNITPYTKKPTGA